MCYDRSLFCFFKQKTAYDMRISDWSSDVCSSDLVHRREVEALEQGQLLQQHRTLAPRPALHDSVAVEVVGQRILVGRRPVRHEIGRASGRERVCQYV